MQVSTVDVARRSVQVLTTLGARAVSRSTARLRGRAEGGQLAKDFTALGPVFVKLGQVIASTPAFFPDALQRELRTLLDQLPPFSADDARRRATRALGDRLEAFDPDPISAASLAQVHRAEIDGRPAAVKVLRPGIERQVELDLAVLTRLAPLIERLLPYGSQARFADVVDDFAATLRGELDLEAEAREMTSAREFLHEVGAGDVFVPEPLGGNRDVLAMELVDGFPIDDRASLLASGIDPGPLLQSMLLRLQEMALVRGRFHGDLHAGNVLVTTDGRQAWIDWGIVGTLRTDEAIAIGRLFAGALDRDFAAVVDALDSFQILPDDRDSLARDLEAAVGPLLAPALPAVDLSTLIRRTIRVMLRHRVDLPLGLVLLAKQLAYFDRYARTLVPERRLMEDATEIYGYFVAAHPELVARISASAPGSLPPSLDLADPTRLDQ